MKRPLRRKHYSKREHEPARWVCPACRAGFATFEARNRHYLRRHTPLAVVPR